ncbi:MAG: SpoVR family protein [Planctomycetia bacterium]|nr:SpoVR family protein [Planctomycetia bacterium]
MKPYNTNLPPHLKSLKDEIEGYARGYGLDFFDQVFEVVDADDLNEIAAYGGFPTRYPHWSFGMQYEELRKSYDYGLSKIYELVINNDPCYAYLMRSNHDVDQKLVMAHVYGHNDFFKNNAYFAHTNRKMMDEMANHGARVRRYGEKYGEDEVEAFIDRCQSIEDLIDIHSPGIKRRDDSPRSTLHEEKEDELKLTRFKSKDYMDDYINPPTALKAEEEAQRKKKEQTARSFPERPEKDVLHFLIDYAPLKPWQRDVLEIVRNEAYYFAPQGQTKILNEGWACVRPESLVATDFGLMKIGDLVDGRIDAKISDGELSRQVYDWAIFPDRDTVWIKTRRGFELEGSTNHRILLPNDGWRQLDQLQIGDRVKLACGTNLWAKQFVQIEWAPQSRVTLAHVAASAGTSIATIYRHMRGERASVSCKLEELLPRYQADRACKTSMQNKRVACRIPSVVDEKLAAFLGYLIGDGHISAIKRTIGLTTGDEPQAAHFAELTAELFEIQPVWKWDRSKWRLRFSSRNLQEFLVHLGLKTGVCAREKSVPDAILRSPKTVVAAFLRALYDCDGYAGKAGVILSTSSVEMCKQVQLLLLNFGIVSTRVPHKDGCWHVHTLGKAAITFEREIGFCLQRKRDALRQYIENHRWFLDQPWEDEIVAIERRRADVYDISVEETHRYAAQGFINHNSYWHTTIMTQKALTPAEVIDYADHHSGTVATHGARLNPYKLGLELLRDIEHRWNTGKFGKEYDECDDLEKRRAWNKQLGLGRQKIFEVRRVHNDITFIDTFLTPDFCREHKMFAYAFQDASGQYVIESREFQKVKQRLLFSLTNFGKPWIHVLDGNFRNRGELLLKHDFNGIELRQDWARDVLANIQYIWSRPVHIETVVDGKPALLSFDGTEHTTKPIGETDDAKRSPPAKAK